MNVYYFNFMNKILLTDIDDTLLHFGHQFEEWLKEHKNFQPVQRLLEVFHIPSWLDIAQEQADNLIHEFCNHTELYSTLPVYFDALEVVPTLYQEGWRIEAITAVPDHKWVRESRQRNLQAHFGDIFSGLHLTGWERNAKRATLEQFEPTIFVEDAAHHAEVAAEVGHTVLMFDRKYNSHVEHENVIRVQDWRDVYRYIHSP
jgi:FMN phosphatase YigB (HAD superfamily)